MAFNRGKMIKALSLQSLAVFCLLSGCVLLATISGVQATIPVGSTFELDGNALNSAAPGTDWDELHSPGVLGFESVFFLSQDQGAPDTIAFTGGGSKDTLDIPNWQYKATSVPDKNYINDAYAASTFFNGERLIYFGADRFSNVGDSVIGFWFFQDDVHPVPGTSHFSGLHHDGDILVVVNFENPLTFTAFVWTITNGSGGLKQVVSASTQNSQCGVDTANFCTITNSASSQAPWAYTPKSGPSGFFPAKSFIEGVVNLSDLNLNANICFASFMAVTRSSTSVSAQLKDFVSSGFQSCKNSADASCEGVTLDCVNQELIYKYQVDIVNSGGIPLDVSVDITYSNGSTGQDVVGSVAAHTTATRHYTETSQCILVDPAQFVVHASVNGAPLDDINLTVTPGSCPCSSSN